MYRIPIWLHSLYCVGGWVFIYSKPTGLVTISFVTFYSLLSWVFMALDFNGYCIEVSKREKALDDYLNDQANRKIGGVSSDRYSN